MTQALGIEVRGADTLARTARDAARQLRDLTAVHRAAAQSIADATSPPRRTGRLAASVGVVDAGPTEASVGSGLVYAPVIESGWPAHGIEGRHYLERAADARWTATVDVYARAVDQAVAVVKGV